MDIAIQIFPILLVGASVTLRLTIISVTIGCIIGLFMGLARLSKNKGIRLLATGYVDFLRGTPLLVQALIVFYGIPQVVNDVQSWLAVNYNISLFAGNFKFDLWTAAIITCSLNSGAYIAEIFRAGVQSIERGQMEAARSLGMTHVQAMRYVVLPQAFRRVIPPLGNEFIALLKDTSILTVIGFEEIVRKAQLMNADMYQPFPIFLTVAFIFLVMTLTFSRLVDWLERRLGTNDRS